MKQLFVMFLATLSLSSLAANTYVCTNNRIDEDATYYKQTYQVKLDVKAMKATVTEADGTMDMRLANARGAVTGNLWCDGGCCVDLTFDAAMVKGEAEGKMKADQSMECEARPVTLKCTKQ